MTARKTYGVLIMLGMMMSILALPAHADGKGAIQRYFSDAATKVKATDSPSEKRDILNGSLQTMSTALDMLGTSASMSPGDAAGIDHIKALVQEKRDELAGTNGYSRVQDGQLNAFGDYVVQDMEQADTVVTISLVTLLLIIILVVLLV
jgi:hypothetical protein